MAAVGLPSIAVALTAAPRASASCAPAPGSALQSNERWDALAALDEATLSAAHAGRGGIDGVRIPTRVSGETRT
jgi:hypothetical protein